MIDLVFIVGEDDSSSQMISQSTRGVRVLLRQTVEEWKTVKRGRDCNDDVRESGQILILNFRGEI